MMGFRLYLITGLFSLCLATTPALARDVAFVETGSGGSATPDEAFKIEPKSEVDIGDSIINIVRRQTLFFVNETAQPVKVEKVSISSDSTVTPLIVNDDCSKQSTLPPLSRCSIELSITPTGPGAWGIELLLTHNGPGRITRAKINGKTAGSDVSDRRERGLFLSTKDTKPIEFGDVVVGAGKIVRSALMVNDSASTITIYSIDVIEADKTLQRLDEGCAVDMELKPGESCPVTLIWTPNYPGLISTDLIIRHSGQLGFAVIPVRGVAKGDENSRLSGAPTSISAAAPPKMDTPPPPSPADIANEVAKSALPVRSSSLSSSSSATGSLHLIGTVGNRAVFLKPNGSSAIVQAGDLLDIGRSEPAQVLGVSTTSATLIIDGKKKDFTLEVVQELKDRAIASRLMEESSGHSSVANNPSGGAGAAR